MTILMLPSSLRTPQILTYFRVICFVYHFTLSPTEINQGCSSEYSCEAIHWNMRSFSRLHHWRQWLPLLWQPPTAISSPAELLIPFMKLLLKGGGLSLVQVYEGYCRSCEFMRVILSCLWHCPALSSHVPWDSEWAIWSISAIPSQNHDPSRRQHSSMDININRRKLDYIFIEQNESS